MNFTKSGKGYIVQTYTDYNIEHVSKLSIAFIILCSGKVSYATEPPTPKRIDTGGINQEFAYFIKRMGQDYNVHMQLKTTRQLLAVDIGLQQNKYYRT